MCSQNQRVRPDCRRNCCGVVGVQNELETHDAKGKGEGSWWSHGAQQHDEKQCEMSAYGKQCGFQGWRPRCSCDIYGGTRIRPRSSRGIRLLGLSS